MPGLDEIMEIVKEKLETQKTFPDFIEQTEYMQGNYSECTQYKGQTNPLCEMKLECCCFYDGQLDLGLPHGEGHLYYH